MIPLAAFEAVIGASGVAPRIEVMLPIGVRPRQLKVRTLLACMCLTQADHRPAHLSRVHQVLVSLPEADQRRLGVITDWKNGPHLLTYRQTERTFGLVTAALGKDRPDGLPSRALQAACDDLLEASIPEQFKDTSTSLAVDWTDLESFSRPPPARGGPCADPEALGAPQEQPAAPHRRAVLRLLPLRRDHDARRERPAGSRVRPPRQPLLVPQRPGPRVRARPDRDARRRDPARRRPRRFRLRPPRRGCLGAAAAHRRRLPGPGPAPARPRPRGTHQGAIIANGNLYCPCTPRSLPGLGPPARDASRDDIAAHDTKTAEMARYKLGRITRDDEDGYHRVQCPAAMGKIRCPLRPQSMTLDRDRPEILTPPEHPQACCTQQTLTVPPDVTAKTAQKPTTPPRHTAGPTPAAPAPNAASPPPKTPPPTTSAAAGAA